jgi:hypothetical protein
MILGSSILLYPSNFWTTLNLTKSPYPICDSLLTIHDTIHNETKLLVNFPNFRFFIFFILLHTSYSACYLSKSSVFISLLKSSGMLFLILECYEDLICFSSSLLSALWLLNSIIFCDIWIIYYTSVQLSQLSIIMRHKD